MRAGRMRGEPGRVFGDAPRHGARGGGIPVGEDHPGEKAADADEGHCERHSPGHLTNDTRAAPSSRQGPPCANAGNSAGPQTVATESTRALTRRSSRRWPGAENHWAIQWAGEDSNLRPADY